MHTLPFFENIYTKGAPVTDKVKSRSRNITKNVIVQRCTHTKTRHTEDVNVNATRLTLDMNSILTWYKITNNGHLFAKDLCR